MKKSNTNNIHTFDELATNMTNLPAGPADMNTRIYASPGEIVARVVTGGGKLCRVLAFLAVDFHGQPFEKAYFNGQKWLVGEKVWWDRNARGTAYVDPPLQGQHSAYPGMPPDKRIQILRMRYLRRAINGKTFMSDVYANGVWSPFAISPDTLAETVNGDLPPLMAAMASLKVARLALAELVAFRDKPEPQKRVFTPKVKVTMPKPKPAEPDHRAAFAEEALDGGGAIQKVTVTAPALGTEVTTSVWADDPAVMAPVPVLATADDEEWEGCGIDPDSEL